MRSALLEDFETQVGWLTYMFFQRVALAAARYYLEIEVGKRSAQMVADDGADTLFPG